VAGGVDARSDEGGGHLAGVAGELVGVLEGGDGVQIDHAIEAVVVGLQLHETRDGPEIIAEMQIARGLNAREHAGFMRHASAPVAKRRLWLGGGG